MVTARRQAAVEIEVTVGRAGIRLDGGRQQHLGSRQIAGLELDNSEKFQSVRFGSTAPSSTLSHPRKWHSVGSIVQGSIVQGMSQRGRLPSGFAEDSCGATLSSEPGCQRQLTQPPRSQCAKFPTRSERRPRRLRAFGCAGHEGILVWIQLSAGCLEPQAGRPSRCRMRARRMLPAQ